MLIKQGRVWAPDIDTALELIRDNHGNGTIYIWLVQTRNELNWYEYSINLEENHCLYHTTTEREDESMNDIERLIKEAVEKRAISVYKGTIKGETLEFWKSAKKAMDIALEQFDEKRREFWAQVCQDIGIPEEDCDKHYRVESLTGQVFEEVPRSKFKKEPEEEAAQNDQRDQG